jgi:hypothetical protein
MQHRASADDQQFQQSVESGQLAPAGFDHRAHVRLAYVYLCERDEMQAHRSMKAALLAYLRVQGVNPAKYHETITRAWIMAVQHFMQRSAPCASADAFIALNPVLLDSRIMLSHYSAQRLFSAEARAAFVAPDVQGIPPC